MRKRGSDDHRRDLPVPDIDANPDEFGVTSWDMKPGDDVRIAFRAEGMDPDFSQIMTEHGLRPGDRPGGDLLPRLWERAMR